MPRHHVKPVPFPIQSKGEWLAMLWLKVVSTTPSQAATLVRT
jgi:hypothetical protein